MREWVTASFLRKAPIEQESPRRLGSLSRFLRQAITLGFCWGVYYFVVSKFVYGHGRDVSAGTLFEGLIRCLIIGIALALIWKSIFTAIDYQFRNSVGLDWRRFVLWQGGLGYGLPMGLF